jgi:hypothetical protein
MTTVRDRARVLGRWIVSFALGCVIGVLLHYMLYRLALPLEPFIYVAF